MRPIEVEVVVNPYGRSPLARIAAVYPQTAADLIRYRPEEADWLLLWPLGEPKTTDTYERPFRWNAARTALALVPVSFAVTSRRAFDPSRDSRNVAETLGREYSVRRPAFEVAK